VTPRNTGCGRNGTCILPTWSLTNSLFVWLISHQPAVLSLRTNQSPATSQQYSSLRTNQHQPSATSQPNRVQAATKVYESVVLRNSRWVLAKGRRRLRSMQVVFREFGESAPALQLNGDFAPYFLTLRFYLHFSDIF
jgi:hypothetical protein